MRVFKPFRTDSFDIAIEKYSDRCWVAYVRVGLDRRKIGFGITWLEALEAATERLKTRGEHSEDIGFDIVTQGEYDELQEKYHYALDFATALMEITTSGKLVKLLRKIDFSMVPVRLGPFAQEVISKLSRSPKNIKLVRHLEREREEELSGWG